MRYANIFTLTCLKIKDANDNVFRAQLSLSDIKYVMKGILKKRLEHKKTFLSNL